MKYMCVKWIHSIQSEPVLIYSELDDKRWEHRKVEIFADGQYAFASKSECKGDSRLSKEPLPLLAEIALDPQFQPAEITQEEFESAWAEAHG